MDQLSGTGHHQASTTTQRKKVEDATRTPSAKVLAAMKDQQISFFNLTMNLSENHRQAFVQEPPNPDLRRRFAALAEHSIKDQSEQEATDTQTFEQFLESYLRVDLV